MPRRILSLFLIGLCGAFFRSPSSSGDEKERKNPAYLSKYDLATPDDLLFSYMLSPLLSSSDASQWAILRDLKSQIGGWVDDALSAKKIADTVALALPIEGQPPLKKLDEIVANCGTILRLSSKPTVYVRNCEEQRVYSFGAGKGSILVITSGLLKLYDNKPDELRFVIGRELGHLKADHSQMRRAGYAILSLIQRIDASAVPDQFQNALPTLALGRFLNWLRESEITADRAGLLCCQDPMVAYSALLRQLHGLPEGNTFLDPSAPAFDEDKVVSNFQQWQSHPLVRFIVYAKQCSADAPFIPDRIAALKVWEKSGRYQELLNRATSNETPKLLTLDTIVVRNISQDGSKMYPYVVAKNVSGATWFSTKTGPAESDVSWQSINQTTGVSEGQPIFFEVWESRSGPDRLIGGFYILAASSQSDYIVRLSKDWKERVSDISPSFAKVRLRLDDKIRADRATEKPFASKRT